MLIAINQEKPDRLPVTVHQWQSYHLNKYLAGISDLEAFEKFGLDAQIQHFGEIGQTQDGTATSKTSTKDWQVSAKVISDSPDKRLVDYAIKTPAGVLRFKTEGNQETTWISDYLVKHDEDIELIRKYLPVPKLNRKVVNELYDRVGERGILRGFVWGEQAGCWQHACGGTLGIEEMIVANGSDVSETLASKSIGGNQEPWEFAARIRGRLALIGGLDQCSVLTDGTKEEIKAKVYELFEKVGRNGGYICSLSDHFFETPLENIQAYADAAREGIY